MSKSRSYRPVLTRQQREALQEQLRALRFQQQVLPDLKAKLTEQIEELSRAGQSDVRPALSRLAHVIDASTHLNQLRTAAVELETLQPVDKVNRRSAALTANIPRVHNPGVADHRLGPVRQLPSRIDDSDSLAQNSTEEALAALRFDLDVLDAEQKALIRAGTELGVDMAETAKRLDSMSGPARTLLARGLHQRAATATAELKTSLTTVADEVDQVLVAAEAKARALAIAHEALHRIGYRITATSDNHIDGTTRSGRLAHIRIDFDNDGAMELDSTFEDPTTAVPTGHPRAGDVCAPAVNDAERFHHLSVHLGLEPVNLRVTTTPTRGQQGGHDVRAEAGGEAEGKTGTTYRRNTRGER